MLNNLLSMIRRYDMLHPGERLFCAVSGGADSMALLWGLYLLREKLSIKLEAVHFNHNLRGAESNRDEEFVRDFCQNYGIPLTVGSGTVVMGKKGLESAARDARYQFFRTLPGKIATAHTADDNAETVLMHLVRGTGLKGLGGITPATDTVIRPMLTVTRRQVLSFLEEYHIPHVEDGSNESDEFLRNRIRHHVMPLLLQENPKISENLSEMAQRLRDDEEMLVRLTPINQLSDIQALKQMHCAQRARALEQFLKESGVREPEGAHIALAESLIFSDNPSSKACFPGNVTIGRCYNRLIRLEQRNPLERTQLNFPGITEIPELDMKVCCQPADQLENGPDVFTVVPQGMIWLRGRDPGDTICLSGGTKSLKKLFIDRKIPQADRGRIPVIADDRGILGVYGIGANHHRIACKLPAVRISFQIISDQTDADT